jgi:translation initiation factor 1
MTEKKRIPTDGELIQWKSPFAALKDVQLPTGAQRTLKVGPAEKPPGREKNRGRVDIIRQTAHRGGKIVTVVTGFTGVGQTEKEQLAREMQKACGTGGTVKEGRIEIQGDKREEAARILTKAGFRPVFAGG